MYGRILVPLKGDDTDKSVVDEAEALARLTGGTVTFLRVIHSHSRDQASIFEEEAAAYLQKQVARLVSSGLAARSRVVWGEPAEGIVGVAGEAEAEVIVMATHGHREVRHLLMGSVTEDVVRNTSVPVLLVRPRHDE